LSVCCDSFLQSKIECAEYQGLQFRKSKTKLWALGKAIFPEKGWFPYMLLQKEGFHCIPASTVDKSLLFIKASE
jgi:hypothetical protein